MLCLYVPVPFHLISGKCEILYENFCIGYVFHHCEEYLFFFVHTFQYGLNFMRMPKYGLHASVLHWYTNRQTFFYLWCFQNRQYVAVHCGQTCQPFGSPIISYKFTLRFDKTILWTFLNLIVKNHRNGSKITSRKHTKVHKLIFVSNFIIN